MNSKAFLALVLLSFAAVSAPIYAGINHATAINTAHKSVTKDFKDPSSAQFRNEYVIDKSGGEYIVCGEVNGKNSYGAYVGFEQYYFTSFSGSMVHSEENSMFFEITYSTYCDKNQ